MKEKCEHDWNYTCLGMYRSCLKCYQHQGNHVDYRWVDLIFREVEPDEFIREAYAIRTPRGKVELLEKVEAKLHKKEKWLMESSSEVKSEEKAENIK